MMYRHNSRCRSLFLTFAACVSLGLMSGPASPPAASRDGIAVYFSPDGGCTGAIVEQIAGAKKAIMLQAYSFTSAPIAQALVDAHKRGVAITAVLDKS